jgi:hypothetical protein
MTRTRRVTIGAALATLLASIPLWGKLRIPEIKRPVTQIIIHHTAGNEKSVSQIRAEHVARGWSDIAYHYVIFPDGRVEQGRDVQRPGAGVYGNNDGKVQIVLVGELQKHPAPPVQWETAAQVAAKIALKEGLRFWDVKGHGEVAIPGHATQCPGMRMTPFRIQVTKEMHALTDKLKAPEVKKEECKCGATCPCKK